MSFSTFGFFELPKDARGARQTLRTHCQSPHSLAITYWLGVGLWVSVVPKPVASLSVALAAHEFLYL